MKDQDETGDQQTIINKLRQLESEHRDLDDVIERLADDKPFDQLKLQRLKKRKLILKDEDDIVAQPHSAEHHCLARQPRAC